MTKQKFHVTTMVICATLLLTSCAGQPEIPTMAMGPNEEMSEPNTSFTCVSEMDAWPTQELIPGIFALDGGIANFFLFKSGDSYMAIDTGEFLPNKAKKELDKLGISSDDVSVVLLTHTDYDHVGAINLFNKATVYLGAPTTSLMTFLPKESLADGEIVDILGVPVQCIYTRGHRESSVCYLIDGKYLFSGDTLSLYGNHVKLFDSANNDDDEMQEEDIIMLSELEGIQYIFTAHYGFTDNPVFPQTE